MLNFELFFPPLSHRQQNFHNCHTYIILSVNRYFSYILSTAGLQAPRAAAGRSCVCVFSRIADDSVFDSCNPRGGLIFNSRKSSMCRAVHQMDIILYFILEG